MADTDPENPIIRICPHCGKGIARLPRTPRDLSLLLNVLIYRVPVELEISEGWIEVARRHCKMTPERLAVVRSGLFARLWPRMNQRRAARLAYLKEHGELPPRWKGLLPGEPDHYRQMAGAHRYRKGGLAKMKSRLRKHPDTAADKLATRYRAANRIKSLPRKSAALDDITARLAAKLGAQTGKLSLRQYETLKALMLPDDAPRYRDRKKSKGGSIHSSREISPKSAGEEASADVPLHVPA